MTGLPNLPTDNLYKFSFLGGLTIVILATFLFFIQGESIKEKSNIVGLDIARITAETKSLHDDLIQLEKVTTALESDIGNNKHPKGDYKKYISTMLINLNDKNYRDYISFISEHENIIFPYNAQIDKLNVKKEQCIEKMKQISLNTEIILVKHKQLNQEFKTFYILLITVIGLIFLGSSIATNGRKGWVKFQKIADEKNEVELSILKKQLEKLQS